MRFRMFHHHPADHTAFGGAGAGPGAGTRRSPLLNVLLTSGGWREDAWAVAVPHILSSTGINIIQARSGVEASNVIRSATVHIAIVDLALPLDQTAIGSEPAGVRVLQLLRRLDAGQSGAEAIVADHGVETPAPGRGRTSPTRPTRSPPRAPAGRSPGRS
jgi:hypothetical protein